MYESFWSLRRTTGRYALVTAELAHAVYDQGRVEEAREFADASATAVSTSDVVAQALRKAAEPKLLVRRRDSESAVALAREAVAFTDTTDMLNVKGRVLSDLGEVLLLAARPDEASRILAEAARLFEQKGNLPSAERARGLTARARGGASV